MGSTPICSTIFSKICAIRPMDGAFLFFANLPSIRGLCKEYYPGKISTENPSLSPLRRLRGQFPPKFSVSHSRRPMGFREFKSRFLQPYALISIHKPRFFENSAVQNLWTCSEKSPKKAIILALNLIFRYRKRRSPDLYSVFFRIFVFWGLLE